MYACETCFESFKQKGHLDDHMKRKNPCVRSAASQAMIEKKAKELANLLVNPPKHAIPEEFLHTWTPSMLSTDVVTPPIKWVGGKTQIMKEVIGSMPRVCEVYHEPFLGGGSVLLAVLSQKKAGNIHIKSFEASDVNATLIHLYKNIQTCLPELLSELKSLTDTFKSIKGTDVNRDPVSIEQALTSQESFYYWQRRRLNSMTIPQKNSPAGSALFVFLNKTCFRGVYREGPHGFNVPFGHYKNPAIYDKKHLEEISQLIQPVNFTVQDFTTIGKAKPGDFIYLDPPYAPIKEDSFVSYTAGGFSKKDHDRLFNICELLTSRGIQFLMSNSDSPLVRKAFPEPYITRTIECKRAIHSKNPGETAQEVLVLPLPRTAPLQSTSVQIS